MKRLTIDQIILLLLICKNPFEELFPDQESDVQQLLQLSLIIQANDGYIVSDKGTYMASQIVAASYFK